MSMASTARAYGVDMYDHETEYRDGDIHERCPDPRGPTREIVSIEERTDGTLLTLTCGHTGTHNQIFTYKVGKPCRCFECGKADTQRWQEKQARIRQKMEAAR